MNLAADVTATQALPPPPRAAAREQHAAQESLRSVAGRTEVAWAPFMHLRVAIEAAGRLYLLRGAFVLSVSEEDGLTVARHNRLGLEGLGDTAEQAIDDFCQNFDRQYRDLVECDENGLSAGARAIRRCLCDVVEHVEG